MTLVQVTFVLEIFVHIRNTLTVTDFYETLQVSSWEHLEHIPTVMVTFVQVTFVLATVVNMTTVNYTIWTKF